MDVIIDLYLTIYFFLLYSVSFSDMKHEFFNGDLGLIGTYNSLWRVCVAQRRKTVRDPYDHWFDFEGVQVFPLVGLRAGRFSLELDTT